MVFLGGLSEGEMGNLEEVFALTQAEVSQLSDWIGEAPVDPQTGTGWIDPEALDTVEYLHDGNVASVAVQYSYLSSWIALLTEPDYGVETARALFQAVYGYWTTLPKETRPKLYLHGLSLGSLNSQKSSDLYDVLADPFQGAPWSGAPFSMSPVCALNALQNSMMLMPR